MTKKESYESRVEAYLLPLMEENNFELVDVEYVKEAGTWYLRAYIDKEGGITIDDCEVFSKMAEKILHIQSNISAKNFLLSAVPLFSFSVNFFSSIVRPFRIKYRIYAVAISHCLENSMRK